LGEDGPALYRVKMESRSRLLWIIGVAVSVAVVWTSLSAIGSPTDNEVKEVAATEDQRLPEPVAPAFAAPDPPPLGSDRWDSVWALVAREVLVRDRPAIRAEVVGRLSTVTPEGTDNIVQSVDRTIGRDGRVWVKVQFPSLPNGAEGWIPRNSIGGYGVVHTKLVVDLGSTTARLYRRGRLLYEAPVGIGQPRWPTPLGDFYIRNRLEGFGDPFYGPVAFGTSARSPVLTDWPAGGFVGIHGTNSPELIPGAVSHGCIRMSNRDVMELSRLMPIGTPVKVRA
jgi:lipoprotein-anchoring transpeptidase ErfK/SrfK